MQYGPHAVECLEKELGTFFDPILELHACGNKAFPEQANANAKHLAEEANAQKSLDSVAEVFRQAGLEPGAIQTQVQTVMSPGAAVTSFVGKANAHFVSLGSHGPGRVLHKSLASYLMQSDLAESLASVASVA